MISELRKNETVASAAPAHWSKDFVEHLRTVHFALILVSAGLMILVLSSKAYDATIALREINEIIELQRLWSPSWLASLYPIPGGKIRQPDGANPFWKPTLSTKEFRTVKGKLRWTDGTKQSGDLYAFQVPEDAWFSEPEFRSIFSAATFPRNLNDFEALWEELRTKQRVEFVGSFNSRGFILKPDYLHNDFSEVGQVTLTESSSNVPSGGRTLELSVWENSPPDSKGQFSKFGLGLQGDIPNRREILFFPAYDYVSFNVSRSWLTFAFKNWKRDEFNVSFRDLDQATRGLESLEFEDIKKIISDEASKGPEVFEAFGMKFPARQVTLGGIVVLFGVQLYFYLYLKQLSGRLRSDDAGWDVPWIGMNQSRAGLFFFFTTLVLFPVSAIALLVGKAISQSTREYWVATGHFFRFTVGFGRWDLPVILQILGLVAGFLAVLLLSLRCWKYRPKISSAAPPCPPQIFE